ncbi:MAG TPA: hypothetical protein DCQ09_00780 [Alcanivorax sp.]|nr:hypothetical protein [Alcanivorax sp.]
MKGGGPAFPQGKQVGQCSVSEGGMTLRDYFAAKALPAIYRDMWEDWRASARGEAPTMCVPEDWMVGVALDAYKMADAMLIARDTDTTER